MDEKHIFKRSKHKPRARHSMDGFITPESFKRTGSLDFDSRKQLDQDQNNKLDDFNRPDGYRPANQALAGTMDKNASTALLPTAPRQRRSPNDPRRRHDQAKRGWRHRRHSDVDNVHAHKKERSWRRIAKRTSIVTVVLIVLVGGWLGFKFARNTTKVFKGNIFGIFKTTKLKGEDKGRVTILLAGNSADDPGHSGANLTDSILLVSIDTVNNNGYMLSIPRDLWVDYGTDECSLGYSGKINAVYECGEDVNFNEAGYPKGGMGLLEKDVEEYFGVDINYYALINYTALRDAVNAIGGVDYTVDSDDPRGIYDPSFDYYTRGPLVKLSNGKHTLNGQQALNLARARGDAYGAYGYPRADFTRTEYQRQLLLAIKDKSLSIGVLSNPAKVSSLSDAIGNNVKTDFRTDEIRRLYDLSKLINNNNVRSVGLADTNVNLITTGPINGVSAVIPRAGVGNYTDIQAFIKRLTSNDPVVKEGASAVVLNASGVSGLAAKQSTVIEAKGITVKAVASASIARADTVIVALNPKLTATKSYLQNLYKVTAVTSAAGYPDAQGYDSDFVIILGTKASTSSQ